MISDDEALPVDRPNLSKDYLAGKPPEDWIPQRKEGFYAKNSIDLRLGTKAVGIDVRASEILPADGVRIAFDRLLLATGAEPVRLTIPGADQPHVHTLRSLADSRKIIAQTGIARSAVVLGASFISLEVAAALRTRGLQVHVVAPDERPMERILGPQIGDFIRALHEENGVIFHLGDTVTSIGATEIPLSSGGILTADIVVAGIGVRPRVALAESAGLTADRGVLVDAYLETSVPGIYAAGDIARWPDPHSGENIRVEHWVVAQRQGAAAAINMLGRRKKFTDVPFFWSQHYDVPIDYVGHAEGWDEIEVEGDIPARDCRLRFRRRRPCAGGRHDLPRHREPRGRTGDGAGRGIVGTNYDLRSGPPLPGRGQLSAASSSSFPMRRKASRRPSPMFCARHARGAGCISCAMCWRIPARAAAVSCPLYRYSLRPGDAASRAHTMVQPGSVGAPSHNRYIKIPPDTWYRALFAWFFGASSF